MASILFVGSFLAGSLLSLLIPVGLLIALAIWLYFRTIMRVPADPEQTAAHAAGVVEREGHGVLPDRGPTSSNP